MRLKKDFSFQVSVNNKRSYPCSRNLLTEFRKTFSVSICSSIRNKQTPENLQTKQVKLLNKVNLFYSLINYIVPI